MKTQWTIGKNADNDFVVSGDPYVSRYHATLLQLTDNVYRLEDGVIREGRHKPSTAGVYVDEMRVKKAILTRDQSFKIAYTTVQVASVVAPLFGQELNPLNPLNKDPSKEELNEAFLKLESIWVAYSRFKKINLAAGIVLTSAGALVGGILLPGVGVLLGGSLARVGQIALDRQEAKITADAEFRAKYKCPKCRYFFGEIPFEKLKKDNKCPSCAHNLF